MARVITAPSPLTLGSQDRSVFLAGSIEMGRAEPWQSEMEAALQDLDVVILNPRRGSSRPAGRPRGRVLSAGLKPTAS